ncbi:MAG: ATP-binding protein [Acidobacteriota bacterium]
MTGPDSRFNPFPGLRPFEAEEDHLFFGREREIDELLRRLRTTRFLSVVGTSGSGKSSLIRSGVIPSLYSGMMVSAGAGWRIATMRPGADPIRHLAEALSPADVLGTDEPELAATQAVLIEATLRRSVRGLVEAVRLARLPAGDNVLVVVDQFEELFRFRRSLDTPGSRDESIAFVKRLLEAARQADIPIYVILTMRADFVGDCMEYPGLAEAVSDGQYLVPRMGRDAMRSAITGPVAVGGGAIAPRLVLRLLNDVADDHDQLPVLQHALMRSWDRWIERGTAGEPLDVADYEDVGTLRQALSFHAEETYQQTGSEHAREVAERVFKALTDTFTDARGVRRPTSVAELAAISGAPEAEVIAVVEVFRQPGRSFLMPPRRVTLTPRSIVDLSHESLMRCWDRLGRWAEEERAAAAFYARLSQAAAWHAQGSAGLWRDPELELALRWRADTQPTAAWARRYDDRFDEAIAFLDRSEAERTRERHERQAARRRKLRAARSVAAIFSVLFVAAVALAYVAWRENARAESNLRLARAAVDESLSSADVDLASAGADVPQMAEFRHQLLDKAKQFYQEFLKQQPRGSELRRELALAHVRLGHIARLLERRDEAEQEYDTAIAQLEALEQDRSTPAQREALANASNWLGETLRLLPARRAAAAAAYERALALQSALVAEEPANAVYVQELARTHYNRGILRSAAPDRSAASPGASADDFREAIRLLEPLAAGGAQPGAAQELARAYNNLASLVGEDNTRLGEAGRLYARAIEIHEGLLRAAPTNRQYRLELAKFCNNDAEIARVSGDDTRALRRNTESMALLDDLLRPPPSLGIEHADALSLRGRILASAGSPGAAEAYRQSLDLFDDLERDPATRGLAAFHLRFGDLLLNLATLVKQTDSVGSRRLLNEAVRHYVAYANQSLEADARPDAQLVLDNLSQLLPELGDDQRRAVMDSYRQLERRLAGR